MATNVKCNAALSFELP